MLERDWPEYIEEMKGWPPSCLAHIGTDIYHRNRGRLESALYHHSCDEHTDGDFNGSHGSGWLHVFRLENGKCLTRGPELGCQLATSTD